MESYTFRNVNIVSDFKFTGCLRCSKYLYSPLLYKKHLLTKRHIAIMKVWEEKDNKMYLIYNINFNESDEQRYLKHNDVIRNMEEKLRHIYDKYGYFESNSEGEEEEEES